MRVPVITGAGAVSAFGAGFGLLLDGLAAGASAVGPIRCFDARGFSSRVGGEVPVDLSRPAWLARELRCAPEALSAWELEGGLRDRKVPFGLLAAAEAWRSARCGPGEADAALSVALGMETVFLDEMAGLLGPARHEGRSVLAELARLADDDSSSAAAAWSAATLPEERGLERLLGAGRYRSEFDTCAKLVRELLGLRGPLFVHASACASGALAVAHAAALVRRGRCSRVLAGAADSMLNPMGLGGLCRLGVPSPRNEPDACRPFDARRDGLVVGEGAAMFVVEDEERARSRDVEPLARIAGWGSSHDGYRPSAPRPDGTAAARAISDALASGGLTPDRIGYVNAHGTGTELNDRAEARALHLALGERARSVPVSSVKGALGHLMAASGAIEIAACLLPLLRGRLPGTAHFAVPDPDCDLTIVGPEGARGEVDAVVSNSFGFGGQNACIVLARAG